MHIALVSTVSVPVGKDSAGSVEAAANKTLSGAGGTIGATFFPWDTTGLSGYLSTEWQVSSRQLIVRGGRGTVRPNGSEQRTSTPRTRNCD